MSRAANANDKLLPHHRRHWPPPLINFYWRQSASQKKAHAYRPRQRVSLCTKTAKTSTEVVAFLPVKKRCAQCRAVIKQIQEEEKHQVAEHFSDLEFRKGVM